MTMYHLYTIAALIMAIMLLHRMLAGPRKPECVHGWAILHDKEFGPKTEIIPKTWVVERGAMTTEFCKRTYYAIVTCPKCGGLKEFRVDV